VGLAVLLVMLADATLPTHAGASASSWVAVGRPSEKLLSCANRSNREWRVFVDYGEVRIEPASEQGRVSEPVVPFELPPMKVPGQHDVLALPGGFVVGTNAGEWGGELWWLNSDGHTRIKLGDANVDALVDLGHGGFMALEGIAHLGLDWGRARWFGRSDTDDWRFQGETGLDGMVLEVAIASNATYIVTTKSLTRIAKDHSARVIRELPIERPWPNSLLIAPNGDFWIGMRHFVLHITGDGKRETWLVPRGCKHAIERDDACVCQP